MLLMLVCGAHHTRCIDVVGVGEWGLTILTCIDVVRVIVGVSILASIDVVDVNMWDSPFQPVLMLLVLMWGAYHTYLY